MKLFTRFRILNAARSMVGEVGVERVTMRGIAARANLTAPAIYKHFRNKRALLDEVIASGFNELGQTMAAAASLHSMIERGVKFAVINPKLTLMMLAPLTDDHVPVRKLETHLRREGCGNARQVARLLWAQLRGQLSMRDDGAPSLRAAA
jgi:AcrR family transcriptional regulator